MFFVLGLCEPLALLDDGRAVMPYYHTIWYLAASGVFWFWLVADARGRDVPLHWTLLVSFAWLAASVFVASAYLVATRGVRKGALASLALIAVILQFFSVSVAGAILSMVAISIVGR